jgi:hypothetical protein
MTKTATGIATAARRVRELERDLDAARAALEREIARDGWAELSRHSVTGSALPAAVTYLRADSSTVDPITGQPCGAQVATLAAFIRGETA